MSNDFGGTALRQLLPAGRWAWIATIGMALAACLTLDAALARHYGTCADYTQGYNELAAIWRGDLLLRHWALATDNFYFTDLPAFVLLRAVFGMHLWLVDAQPIVVYAVLLAAGIAILRREAEGRALWPAFAFLYLAGVPVADDTETLLQPDIHTATIAVCLLALLCVQDVLGRRRQNPVLYFPFILLTVAACASDPMAQAFFACPLAVFLVLRVWLVQGIRRDDAILLAAALSAIVLAALFPTVLAHNHGFAIVKNFSGLFVTSVPQLLRNGLAFARSIQMLFQARLAALHGAPAAALLAASRLTAMAAVLGLSTWVAIRMPRRPGNGVAQFLVFGGACLAALEILSDTFSIAIGGWPEFPGPAVRYSTPVFVFLSLAGVLQAQALLPRLPSGLRAPAAWAGLAFTAVFALSAGGRVLHVARGPSGLATLQQRIALYWIIEHHFDHGLADYWTAQVVTALTQGRVRIAPILMGPSGRLVSYHWADDTSIYDRMRDPQFVIFTTRNTFNLSPETVAGTYGGPNDVTTLGPYTLIALGSPGPR